MLFEVYGFMDRQRSYPKSFWAGNVWHGPNNINAINVTKTRMAIVSEFFFTSRRSSGGATGVCETSDRRS